MGHYDFSQESFIKLIKYQGVNLDKVVICPGFYSESLTKEFKIRTNLNAACIIMIDCDLYESTVLVLEFITDLLQQGTILIFDDWFAFRGDPKKGEKRAVREWLDWNSQFTLEEYAAFGPVQRAFIVHKAF
jgi:O-methyltransferase